MFNAHSWAGSILGGRRDFWTGRAGIFILLVAVPAAVILSLHARQYVGFFADDSFISLRYARRLLQGRGLSYTDGEHVEGYTNFLWVVLVAAGGLVSRDLVAVARVIGTFATVLSLVVVTAVARPRRLVDVAPAMAVSTALALSGPVATWAVGGLETPLFCASIVSGFALAYTALETDGVSARRQYLAGVPWALAVLTRPDGLLFPLTAAAAVVVMGRLRRAAVADAFRLAAIPVGAFLLHSAFRRAYYGDWVPNTFHAKVALSMHRVHEGLDYVASSRECLVVFLPPLLLTVIAAISEPSRRRRIVLVGVPLLAWGAYVVAIGGDIMRHYRHAVPALFLLALLDSEGVMWLAGRRGRWAWTGSMASAALVMFALLQLAKDPGRADTLNEQWEWSGRNVGLFLQRAFAKSDALLAVDAAGATPYYSELDTLDMLGLNDRFLAMHPPRGFGTGWMGHELGDGRYALRRKPDLVMFVIPPGWEKPMARGSLELFALPAFHRLYKPIRFDTRSTNRELALLWVRKEDSRVGMRRQGDDLVVPGFLLAGKDRPVAGMVAGSLRAIIDGKDVGGIANLVLDRGSYRLDADVAGAAIFKVVVPGGVSASGGPGLAFGLEQPSSRVALEARSGDGQRVLVSELRLVRVNSR